jgi:hypothetical protein
MKCKDVEAQVTAYLDGELDATTSSALRGHARGCEHCRALVADHARIAGTLAALPPAEPGPAMWDGVMAKLAQAEQADSRRSGLGLRFVAALERMRAHLVPVTAVAAAAVVAGVWFARQRASTPVAPEKTAIAIPAPVQVKDVPVAPPAPADDVDIEAALAREAARIDDVYASTVADLLEDAAEERAEWTPSRQRAFDAELARLQANVAAHPTEIALTTGDAFDAAEARTAAREARDRAWQRLVKFLQRAAVGDLVAEVTR